MAVGRAQARVLLAEIIECCDGVHVPPRAEMCACDREQELRVVLEHAAARVGANLDGVVEPPGAREPVGKPARGLDVRTALVLERGFTPPPARVDRGSRPPPP